MADQIDAWDPEVVAYLGDVYDRGTPQELDTWYGDATGYGRFRDITNPAVGNHEYMTSATAAPYLDYWGQVPHYYSYDVGGWHVVVLDSIGELAQVYQVATAWSMAIAWPMYLVVGCAPMASSGCRRLMPSRRLPSSFTRQSSLEARWTFLPAEQWDNHPPWTRTTLIGFSVVCDTGLLRN